jgi:hypothetical protein
MKSIIIDILTNEPNEIEKALYGHENVEIGDKSVVHEGLNIEKVKPTNMKGFGIETGVTFVLSFLTGVSSGLIANWLYEKARGSTTIMIDGFEVIVDKEKIKRIVEEKINQNGIL